MLSLKEKIMKKLLIITTLIFTFSSSIYAQRTIKGNGISKVETRKTTSYDKITLMGSAEVDLVSGKEGNLSISGDENLLEYIETNVVNNELIIKLKDKHNYNTKNPLKVTVPVQDISAITLKGSGDINSKTTLNDKNISILLNGSGDISLLLNSENVQADLLGSGDIELKGKTTNLNATVKGSGDLKASNLKSEVSDLKLTGSGDIDANATKQVTASILGSGDIKISGNPQKVKKEIKGSGDIVIK